MRDQRKVAIGRRFAQIREEKKLTQRVVAETIEISVQTVSNFETGLTIPQLKPKAIQTLCDLYGISFDDYVEMTSLN